MLGHRSPYDLTERNISGCGLSAVMSRRGNLMNGEAIIRSIGLLEERGNGLGGGFAVYGCYPQYPEEFAFHLMYYSTRAKEDTERYLDEWFEVVLEEPIPTRPVNGVDPSTAPLLWRYFLHPKPLKMAETMLPSPEDFVQRAVIEINGRNNADNPQAFIFSSGKNMGAFKAVGSAKDVGRFYRLEEYDGYTWIAHDRFPTNTPGWWGGAHPFTMLDFAVVHNGEISSYGINKRYLEQFGYQCTLRTDTEVIAYLLDLLLRRHHLPMDIATAVLAAPFWKDIDTLQDTNPEQAELYKTLRTVYAGALINGPFAIVFGHRRGMVGLNDRIKLRPLVAAEKDDLILLSSEESGILEMCADPDRIWSPRGGEPVIVELDPDVYPEIPSQVSRAKLGAVGYSYHADASSVTEAS
ncbi:MAG: class II glutamine amidotransferase [Armatimonadota bacterium]